MTKDTKFDLIKDELTKLVKNWKKHRGGDLDELYQEAYLAYRYAAERFDGRGDFVKYCLYIVRLQLLERAENVARQKTRFHNSHVLHNIQDGRVSPDPESLDELIDKLSEDSQLVALIVLNPPKKIKFDANERRQSKKVLKSYLISIGWSFHRVSQAYRDLAKVLGGSS